jgi:hypothetical protein
VVKTYRFYCFDGAGQIIRADWIEAAEDEEAARTARRTESGFAKEVWDGTRLVARIERDSA